ncbi:hypothetical protein TNCV_4443931 [Trichonephila clavipes]|nr:hypothetical protein TNCV_4443931 [Trichonephila clavipes]
MWTRRGHGFRRDMSPVGPYTKSCMLSYRALKPIVFFKDLLPSGSIPLRLTDVPWPFIPASPVPVWARGTHRSGHFVNDLPHGKRKMRLTKQ